MSPMMCETEKKIPKKIPKRRLSPCRSKFFEAMRLTTRLGWRCQNWWKCSLSCPPTCVKRRKILVSINGGCRRRRQEPLKSCGWQTTWGEDAKLGEKVVYTIPLICKHGEKKWRPLTAAVAADIRSLQRDAVDKPREAGMQFFSDHANAIYYLWKKVSNTCYVNFLTFLIRYL